MAPVIKIKKTPVTIMKQLVVAEVLITAAYQFARILADYGELYQSFILSSALPYELAKFVLKLAVETWIVGYFLLQWYFSEYAVYADHIERTRGVVFKKKETTPLTRPVSVSYAYGPLSRMFSYGT